VVTAPSSLRGPDDDDEEVVVVVVAAAGRGGEEKVIVTKSLVLKVLAVNGLLCGTIRQPPIIHVI
jgi:hypothetical protein